MTSSVNKTSNNNINTKNEEKEKQASNTQSKRQPNNENLQRRSIVKNFRAHSQKEGAGFICNRPIGGPFMNSSESDPFLLLDELGPVVYKKGEFPGAPWHPHRGFDTVMYIKEGAGAHQDSMGNKGILHAGDCQWMTAGSGIIHDEGRDHPGGVLHGFQMWVNLPRKHKMCPPQYQKITAKNFPFIRVQKGIQVKVIVGKLHYNRNNEPATQQSPLKPIVPAQYFDYLLDSGQSFVHIIDKDMRSVLETAILYVYEGVGSVYDKNGKWVDVKRRDTIKFSVGGDCIEFRSTSKSKFGFLLLFGQPIREPIAWRGPFVMNTQKEIQKCFSDYREGKLATVKGKSFVF